MVGVINPFFADAFVMLFNDIGDVISVLIKTLFRDELKHNDLLVPS